MKLIKRIFIVMIIATLISAMAVATTSATTDMKNDKKNSGISIESKEKKVSNYRITWNGNGGKIGNKKTKTTTVKRGSKIGKLVSIPKKTDYSFKGWYTKKISGKKITKNTKPTKNTTYYAQWQKKPTSRVLTSEEKKLVGRWIYGQAISSRQIGSINWIYDTNGNGRLDDGSSVYVEGWFFKSDGTYNSVSISTSSGYISGGTAIETGKWRVSTEGTLHFTERKSTYYSENGRLIHKDKKYPNDNYYYELETENGKKGVRISFSPNVTGYFFCEKQ